MRGRDKALDRVDIGLWRYGQVLLTSLVWLWVLVEAMALLFRPLSRFYFMD